MIRYITTDKLESYWPVLAPLIEPALDEEIAIEDVYHQAMDERMAIMSIADGGEIVASCVCEFVDYPQLRALRVVALGGKDMKKWLSQLIEFLDTWAIEQKMDRVEQMGRDGWMRVLNEYGYKKRYTFMTKELSYG